MLERPQLQLPLFGFGFFSFPHFKQTGLAEFYCNVEEMVILLLTEIPYNIRMVVTLL